jgi:hypothetical protein
MFMGSDSIHSHQTMQAQLDGLSMYSDETKRPPHGIDRAAYIGM